MNEKQTAICSQLEYVPELCDGASFEIKIAGTTYEVVTHFNPEGRQSVLEQFRDLLLRENCS